ncbi:MAG: hypothetical protein ABSA57_12800 [Candidatus Acidiferrales bacterium]
MKQNAVHCERRRWMFVLLALGLVMILSSRLLARSAAQEKAGAGMAHDLSGIWNAPIGQRAQVPGQPPHNPPPPLTPAGQAQFDSNTRDLKSDHPITVNPVYQCHPPGLPNAYTNGGYPFEIVQTPQRIFIFYESTHLWREIWMDGREMPKDSDPLWMGYSVGHWDGDDLLVDTANFNDKTWIDNLGHPHSDAMRLTERFHRPDHEHLQIEFVIDDPNSYTAPWTIRYHYDLKPNWEIGEAFCIPEDQQRFLKKNVPETTGKSLP